MFNPLSAIGGGGLANGNPDFEIGGAKNGTGGTGPDIHMWDFSKGFPQISNSGAGASNFGNIFSGMGGGGGTYHADTPAINQVDFATALKNQLAGQGKISGQQQDLANALQQQALGQGPQAQLIQNQLQQATNANIAQGAGALAQQKGINPALAARMIGQNTASLNQQAVGQGINAQLASRLGAQDQLGGVLQGMGGLNNQYASILTQGNTGQNAAINEGKLGNQKINADIAIQQMKGRQGLQGGLINAGGGVLAGLMGSGAGEYGGGGTDSGAQALGDSDFIGGATATAAHGGKIPGQAPMPGDHPENDIVNAKLSPGEIVIPRSHAGSPEAAKSFIDALMKKGGKRSYADVVKKKDAAKKAGEAVESRRGYYDAGYVEPDSSSPDDLNQANEDFYKETAPSPPEKLPVSDLPPIKSPQLYSEEGNYFTTNGPEGLQTQEKNKDTQAAYEAAKNAPVDSVNVNTATPSAITAPEAPKPADPYADSYNEMVKGIQGNVAAAQEYGNKASKAMEDAAAQAKAAHAEYQKKYDVIEGENQKLTGDILNQKIDPNRVWANASTGSKIAAGIGMLLSGIGSGMSGQPNLAMKVIDDTIGRDVDAQKAELGKKENLLSFNLRKYGDMRMAEQATTAQLYAAAQGQVAAAAAKMGGAQAAAQGHAAMGQLDMQRAQLQHGLALQGLGQSLANGGKGTGNDILDAKGLDQTYGAGKWVKLPGGKIGVADTPEDAKLVKETQTAAADLKGTIARMQEFMQKGGTSYPGSQRNSQAEALHAEAYAKLNHLAGLARMSDKDIQLMVDQIPDPGAFRQDRAKTKLGEMSNLIDSKLDAVYANHLVNHDPGAAKSTDTVITR